MAPTKTGDRPDLVAVSQTSLRYGGGYVLILQLSSLAPGLGFKEPQTKENCLMGTNQG